MLALGAICSFGVVMKHDLTGLRAASVAWPPNPPDTTGTFVCRVMGKSQIGYKDCTDITASPNRSQKCGSCTSAWRICIVCAVQRASHGMMRQVNPVTGMCPFHDAHGVHAVAPSEEPVGESVSTIRARFLRVDTTDQETEADNDDGQELPVQPSLLLPESHSASEPIVLAPILRNGTALRPEQLQELSYTESMLRAVAIRMPSLLSKGQLEVARLLSEGRTAAEIVADENNPCTTEMSVMHTLHTMARNLSIGTQILKSFDRQPFLLRLFAEAYRRLP